MPITKLFSVAFYGLETFLIEIEVDARNAEKPSLVIVGLPDLAVKESKDRVIAAIKNSEFKFHCFQATVNLAPAHLKKEGTLFDLPIALGVLESMGELKTDFLRDYLIIGELALSGDLRHFNGALAAATLAKKLKKRGLIIPYDNHREASLIPGLEVIPVKTLNQAVNYFEAGVPFIQTKRSTPITSSFNYTFDFIDIKGQESAKRALEIAAAGDHNILLSGPPGTGKSLLARTLPSIMPPLDLEEAIEVTKIHSIAGTLVDREKLMTLRPFRSPHHTISYAGLIGGGTHPKPGEVALAHKGVLFLDELPEFSRMSLEVLRQPLEDREVTISRSQGHITFPSHFLFIAAMNPCPCGNHGHPDKPCRDSEQQILKYRSKISGPLLDRIDLYVSVPPLRFKELTAFPKGESSSMIRERVLRARERQKERFKKNKTNSEMRGKELKEYVPLGQSLIKLMETAFESLSLSARSYDRILKISRTIADLAESKDVNEEHLIEALQYRVIN